MQKTAYVFYNAVSVTSDSLAKQKTITDSSDLSSPPCSSSRQTPEPGASRYTTKLSSQHCQCFFDPIGLIDRNSVTINRWYKNGYRICTSRLSRVPTKACAISIAIQLYDFCGSLTAQLSICSFLCGINLHRLYTDPIKYRFKSTTTMIRRRIITETSTPSISCRVALLINRQVKLPSEPRKRFLIDLLKTQKLLRLVDVSNAAGTHLRFARIKLTTSSGVSRQRS